MLKPGDVISYRQMCVEENFDLQKGMNFHLRGGHSIFLMSRRKGAKYDDAVEGDGKVLIYEGHDRPKKTGQPDSKTVDQPMFSTTGLTENGLFFEAGQACRAFLRPNFTSVPGTQILDPSPQAKIVLAENSSTFREG